MKKWYVITGILALLLVISLSTCSSNSARVDRLKDVLKGLEAELGSAKTQLAQSEAELADTKAELSDVNDKLERLQATKEMVFGEGLRIFDISHDQYGNVEGKVQNISDKPMERIEIIVAFYVEEGTLLGLDFCYTVSDLFPQETAEWSAFRPQRWYGREINGWDVYAIGNKR